MQNKKKIWLIVIAILLVSIVSYGQIKPSFSGCGCSCIQYRNPHPAPLQEKNIRFEDIVKQ